MHLSDELYGQLLDRLNALPFQEKAGSAGDIRFMANEFWLQDTAVIDHVHYKKGMYCVSLVFSHYRQPHLWLCRNICSYANPRRAHTSAHYMRRQAAKDQRGTLTLSLERYHINVN